MIQTIENYMYFFFLKLNVIIRKQSKLERYYIKKERRKIIWATNQMGCLIY